MKSSEISQACLERRREWELRYVVYPSISVNEIDDHTKPLGSSTLTNPGSVGPGKWYDLMSFEIHPGIRQMWALNSTHFSYIMGFILGLNLTKSPWDWGWKSVHVSDVVYADDVMLLSNHFREI